MPHMMFWMAIESAKISRLQPRASVIGARNRPMIERGPKDSSEIRQPATITTGRATATARFGAAEAFGIGSDLSPIG